MTDLHLTPLARSRRTWTTASIAGLLAVILAASLLVAVAIGSTSLSLSEIIGALGDPLGSGPTHDIVWLVRLPRTLLAMCIGAALAVAGVVMQAIVKNPLADPYILGISSGASLGATLSIIVGMGSLLGGNAVGVFAFAGALAVSFLVQLIANIGGRADAVRLLLAGMALSAVCSAFTSLVVFLAQDAQGLQRVTFWLMGSVAGAKWENLAVIGPVVIGVTVFFLTQTRILNLMLLGDETALTLGTDLNRYRQVYLVLSALAVGMAVYAAGTIGFVGLLIPHLVRMLCGTDHRRVLLFSAQGGASFLIWADIAARTVLPSGELPIGILISAVGAPAFIWLLIRRTYGFGSM